MPLLQDLVPVSLKSHAPSQISSTCSVFAESEVVSLLAQGVPVADIVSGIHKAIANRLVSMIKKVGVKKDFTVTGGVAKNIGVLKFPEEGLGEKITKLPQDPQLVGAIEAAVIAQEKLARARA